MARDHKLYKNNIVILDIARGNRTLTPSSHKEHSLIEMRHIGGHSPSLDSSTGIKQNPAMVDKVMIAVERKA